MDTEEQTKLVSLVLGVRNLQRKKDRHGLDKKEAELLKQEEVKLECMAALMNNKYLLCLSQKP